MVKSKMKVDLDEESLSRLQERIHPIFRKFSFRKRPSKIRPTSRPKDDNNNIMKRELEILEKVQNKRSLVTSITIQSGYLLSADLWPKTKPEEILCENLKELHIQVPSKDKIQNMRNCRDKLFEFFGLRTVETCLEKEERMKKNVYYILEVLYASNLACFSFQNGRYGSYLTHTTGFIFWDVPLKSFLSKHAKSLKRVYIDTMGSPVQLNSISSWNYLHSKRMYIFPVLEEISLHLWNWNNVDRNLFDPCNYWISLLNMQITNTLRKLEWYSCESLSWNQMISPIIQQNEKSLQEIHILGFGCPIEAVVADSKLYSSGFAIDCTQFSFLSHLTVIKLQMFRSNLINLELLPPSIQEIEIHCVRIRSSDLSQLCNLPRLRKLTLFNLDIANISWWYPSPCGFGRSSLKDQFGVDRNALKWLLAIRSLHLLHICGFIRTPSTIPESAALHGISGRKKLSSTTIVNGFSKKTITDDDKELDTMLSILKQIANDCDRSLLRITDN